MTIREAFNSFLDWPLESLVAILIGFVLLVWVLWFVLRGLKAFIVGFREGYNEED
jgi:hypothetical protein